MTGVSEPTTTVQSATEQSGPVQAYAAGFSFDTPLTVYFLVLGPMLVGLADLLVRRDLELVLLVSSTSPVALAVLWIEMFRIYIPAIVSVSGGTLQWELRSGHVAEADAITCTARLDGLGPFGGSLLCHRRGTSPRNWYVMLTANQHRLVRDLAHWTNRGRGSRIHKPS